MEQYKEPMKMKWNLIKNEMEQYKEPIKMKWNNTRNLRKK